MRNRVDSTYVANSVRLHRQQNKKISLLLVEGVDDVHLLSKFIDSEHCLILNGFGKENVVRAVLTLEEDGYLGLCGVVDADFDALFGVSYDSENIIVLSCHDMDLLLFLSPALEVYLLFAGDEEKLRKLGNDVVAGIQAIVFDVGKRIGVARFVSERDGLNLFFKNLEYQEIVEQETVSLKPEWCQHLVDRSNTSCTGDRLRALVEVELKQLHPLRMICQGHDAASILGIALREFIGKRKVAQTYGSEVEMGLRLSLDLRAFLETDLAAKMKAWETRNMGWRLLADY